VTAIVTRGDAANLLLPDETVDLIITSPPYFGLRSYQDGGEHYAEQIGAEATPAEYLDALVACTAEWMRVLKPGGSIFVNLGDKYASYEGNRGRGGDVSGRIDPGRNVAAKGAGLTGGGFVKAKSLMLLPQRYAIRCIDELGLILRAEIVWAKPNGLPESVTDRVRRSHEQVFHFVKQPRYYSAVDEVREGYAPGTAERTRAGFAGKHITNGIGAGNRRTDLADGYETNPLGKLPGSVWTIPTAPLKVPEHLGIDHFAAYPPELVRRIVLGWSPREVCTACGEGRRPVSVAPVVDGHTWAQSQQFDRMGDEVPSRRTPSTLGYRASDRERHLTGYACACGTFPADSTACARCGETDLTSWCDMDGHLLAPATTPGVVLDPFGGTGTTALVASAYGRVGISVDLSNDYVRLAQWRTTDPGERARVLGVAKPPAQVDGQLGMFEGVGA
jgi:DNA modification methylase